MNNRNPIEGVPTMSSEFSPQAFDAASKAWTANKVRYGQASYRYKKTAFPKDTEEPPLPKQSAPSKKQTDRELEKRQALEEEAPLPVRKSPRLLDHHRRETYTLLL
jgi:hypothetical protein